MRQIRPGELPRSRYFYGFVGATLLVFLVFALKTSRPLINRDRAPQFQQISIGKDNTTNVLDWSRFAYVQYATNLQYLCNSVMVFESLCRLGSKPDRLLLYPSRFSTENNSTEAILLRKVRDEYKAILSPIEVQSYFPAKDDRTWADCYTKLLAFNQTQYERVLHLDSDSAVLQPMDELFHIEPPSVAMPRAYWLGFDNRALSSQLVLLKPSTYEFDRLVIASKKANGTKYDMDILTDMYKDAAMLLPHRPYNMISGEFRSSDHSNYLGDPEQPWDPDKVLQETKFVHFSDWPLQKPWVASSREIKAATPVCDPPSDADHPVPCRDGELWASLYEGWLGRRKDICNLVTSEY